MDTRRSVFSDQAVRWSTVFASLHRKAPRPVPLVGIPKGVQAQPAALPGADLGRSSLKRVWIRQVGHQEVGQGVSARLRMEAEARTPIRVRGPGRFARRNRRAIEHRNDTRRGSRPRMELQLSSCQGHRGRIPSHRSSSATSVAVCGVGRPCCQISPGAVCAGAVTLGVIAQVHRSTNVSMPTEAAIA